MLSNDDLEVWHHYLSHSAKHPNDNITLASSDWRIRDVSALQWHSLIENAFAQHGSVALHFLKYWMHNTYSSSTCFYGGGHGMTWDGGLLIVILLALSLSYSLFSLTGSMPWTVTEWSQPSSAFSVRSKRRRVSFYFTRSVCVPQLAQVNLVWSCTVLLLQFPRHKVTCLQPCTETV